MTLQKIEFEYNIPNGYRFVRIGEPVNGERFLSIDGSEIITFNSGMIATDRMIVEKIPEQEQPEQNPKRHKHADLIHAWAEGAEIQYQMANGTWDNVFKNHPTWNDIEIYRIKPKPKTVRFRNYLNRNGELKVVTNNKLIDSCIWLSDWQEVEIEDNE